MRGALAIAALAAATTLTGCGGAADPGSSVLVLQDGSIPGADAIVSPAVLALEAGLDGTGVGIRVVDTGGSDGVAADAVAEAVADPGVLAVVVAPFAGIDVAAQADAAAGGLAVLSLSGLGPAPPEGGAWRRFVPAVSAEGTLVAGALTGSAPCVAGDGTQASNDLTRSVMSAGGPSVKALDLDPVGAGAAARDCSSLAWTGSAEGAVELATAIAADPVPLVLGSAARTPRFVEEGFPNSVGALGACGCADLTTSVTEEAQAFLHAYQSATGLDPGPYAVEGGDVAAFLAPVIEGSAPAGRRAAVAEATAALSRFVGLSGTYIWDPSGEPVGPDVRMYRATGVRWVPLEVP